MSYFETISTTSVVYLSVLAGRDHTCGVTDTNHIRCWGDNEYGQLGNGALGGTQYNQGLVDSMEQFTAVTGGAMHSCGLTVTGAAFCWGDNSSGQLGTGDTTARYSPTAVTGGHQFTALAAGYLFTCGLKTSGQVWCWGNNAVGNLGNGTTTDSMVPVQVSSTATFETINIGSNGNHVCALSTAGEAYCGGANTYGQIATGRVTERARSLRPPLSRPPKFFQR